MLVNFETSVVVFVVCNVKVSVYLYDLLDYFSPLFQGAPWTGVGYFPSFPASAPYVTAVGATQGPESDDPEIACQSQEGGVITTGTTFLLAFNITVFLRMYSKHS